MEHNWFWYQWEWFKSFLSEPKENGGQFKGSSRRCIEVAIMVVFMVSYTKIALFNKDLLDIPTMWWVTLASILGFKTIDKALDIKLKGNGKEIPK